AIRILWIHWIRVSPWSILRSFQPVHGSAPDIAGKGIANPVAAVWTAAMMLDHLGEPEAAHALESAIEVSLESDATRTGDLGGTATTAESEAAILRAIG
ncbi:MAG: isocitrate/isopropylmalate family dehydrogenase, partial [Pseudomonadota bacterium]